MSITIVYLRDNLSVWVFTLTTKILTNKNGDATGNRAQVSTATTWDSNH